MSWVARWIFLKKSSNLVIHKHSVAQIGQKLSFGWVSTDWSVFLVCSELYKEFECGMLFEVLSSSITLLILCVLALFYGFTLFWTKYGDIVSFRKFYRKEREIFMILWNMGEIWEDKRFELDWILKRVPHMPSSLITKVEFEILLDFSTENTPKSSENAKWNSKKVCMI